MKKYIKPATEIINIETEQVIAASPGSGLTFDDNGSGTGGIFDKDATGPGMSKGHGSGLWDEDED
ncbi:MAG: hypothetical protein J6K19_05565 [Prevotella sp.]|nr:hypothetical protein [Prevotella sp.]